MDAQRVEQRESPVRRNVSYRARVVQRCVPRTGAGGVGCPHLACCKTLASTPLCQRQRQKHELRRPSKVSRDAEAPQIAQRTARHRCDAWTSVHTQASVAVQKCCAAVIAQYGRNPGRKKGLAPVHQGRLCCVASYSNPERERPRRPAPLRAGQLEKRHEGLRLLQHARRARHGAHPRGRLRGQQARLPAPRRGRQGAGHGHGRGLLHGGH